MTFKIDLGGTGILDLEILGWALRMRWLRLKKTQPDQPWAGLDTQVHPMHLLCSPSQYPSVFKCICSVLHLDHIYCWGWQHNSFLEQQVATWKILT